MDSEAVLFEDMGDGLSISVVAFLVDGFNGVPILANDCVRAGTSERKDKTFIAMALSVIELEKTID